MLEMAAIGIDVFAVSVLLKRQPAKSLDQSTGKFVTTPAPDPATIKATVQPTSGKALRDLPEGLRNEAQYTMWTREIVANDDRVVHEGMEFRIIHVWPRTQAGYYRAALGMIHD